MALIRPPRLRAGARVALVAPAGPVTEQRISHALEQCTALGLVPVLGEHARGKNGYLSAPDAERARDVQAAIDDDSIEAIWGLRGGYGTMRLLPLLDLHRMRARPKAYIGFSDNTTVHLALLNAGVISFHAPHAGGDFGPDVQAVFRSVLFEAKPAGRLPLLGGEPAQMLTPGRVAAPLIGGNLALLAALCGTPYQPMTAGRILFLEDVGEPAYRVDRMLMQLKLAGVFDGVAGVAVGQFTECEAREGEPDASLVVNEFVRSLGVPAATGFPIGHVPANWTLPVGVRAELDADDGAVSLLEAAVTDTTA